MAGYNFAKVTPRQERGSGYVGVHIGKKYRINFSRGFIRKHSLESEENFSLYCDAKNNAIKIYFDETGEFTTKKTTGAQIYGSCTSGLKHLGMKQGRYLVEEVVDDDQFIFVLK